MNVNTTVGKSVQRAIQPFRRERRVKTRTTILAGVKLTRVPSCSFKRYPATLTRQTQRRAMVLRCEVATDAVTTSASGDSSTEESTAPQFSVAAAKQLKKATRALRSYGWFGFWCQLALGITSGVVLLFSIAFTAQAGPKLALYLTALGVSATFISCFQHFGMIRTARRMRNYLESPPGVKVRKVSKEMVLNSISQSLATSITGLSCTVVAMQSLVGLLLAKTLTNTTANPFVAGSQASWNPVLAIDVFLLQASTNTILSHTIGAMISLWLLIKLRDRSLWEALFGITKQKVASSET